MLEKLHAIQTNKTTLDKQDMEMSKKYNGKYVDPILNQPKMVEERIAKLKELNS